jgi:prevent-host-death family protein
MNRVDQVNMHDAKTNLSKLIARVERGEEIIVARDGKPVAKLVPFQETPKPRVPGSAKGRIWIGPDFDDPLPFDLFAEPE